MKINIQKALSLASNLIGSDALNKAQELSKGVNSKQSALQALSKMGNSNEIIQNGLNQLNSAKGQRLAQMFGVTGSQLDDLKNQIMGLNNNTVNNNVSSTPPNNNSFSDRVARLRRGLK